MVNTKEKKLGGYKMAGAVMNKIWDFLGMDNAEEAEELDEKVYDYDYEDEEEQETRTIFGRNKKVVNMPQTEQIKMVISQPTTFEQSEAICDLLKEKK